MATTEPDSVTLRPEESKTVEILIDDSTESNLHANVVGTNCFCLRTRIRYDHPEILPWLKNRNLKVFRWPGGTPTNYYDWETGKAADLDHVLAFITKTEQLKTDVSNLDKKLKKFRMSSTSPIEEIKSFKGINKV